MTPMTQNALAAAPVRTVARADQPGRTWRVDWQERRLGEWIDGRQAAAQAAEKILRTPRFAHLIYSWGYGQELDGLIGQPLETVEAALPRLLREALTWDERITGVENVELTPLGRGAVQVTCTVNTVFGPVEEEVVLGG